MKLSKHIHPNGSASGPADQRDHFLLIALARWTKHSKSSRLNGAVSCYLAVESFRLNGSMLCYLAILNSSRLFACMALSHWFKSIRLNGFKSPEQAELRKFNSSLTAVAEVDLNCLCFKSSYLTAISIWRAFYIIHCQFSDFRGQFAAELSVTNTATINYLISPNEAF